MSYDTASTDLGWFAQEITHYDNARAGSREAIFDEVPHVAIMFDSRFRAVDFNPTAMRFFGYDDKSAMLDDSVQFIKDSIPKHQPTGRKSVAIEERLATAARAGCCEYVSELMIKDRMYMFRVIMKRVQFIEPFGVIVYLVRRQEHEERARIMLDSSPLANIFISSGAGGFVPTDCNMETVRIFGFRGKMDFLERYEETLVETQPCGVSSLEMLNAKMAEALGRDGERVTFEFVFKDTDGVQIPVEITLSRVVWYDTNAFVCCVRDLRQLKEAENNLLVYSRLLEAVNVVSEKLVKADIGDYDEAILDSLEIIARAAGLDTAYIWENFERDGKMCCRRLYEISDGTGQRSTLDPEAARALPYDDAPVLKRTVFGGKPLNMPVKDMDNPERGVLKGEEAKSVLIAPIYNHDRPWGFIGINDNHCERVFAGEVISALQSAGALIASNIYRYRLIHSLVEARESALASVRAKSEFLSRMSHEVRTPMNAIIGMTKLAQKSGDISIIKSYLDTVESSADQLLDIINNVLDMSNIDTGNMRIVYKEFDFDKMLKSAVDLARVKFDDRKIAFSIEHPHAPVTRAVFGDERRVSQVLMNMLDNAAKFTSAGGTVSLRIDLRYTGEPRSALRIEVSDSGCGISQELLERIFQPFEQADGSLIRKYGGIGLGLAICKNLVDLMDGDIRAESEVGRGSTFIVEFNVKWGRELRAKLPDAASSAAPAGPAPKKDTSRMAAIVQRSRPEYDFGGKTILLAEDIEVNRRLISLFLEDTGVKIDNANDGAKVVEMYAADPEKYSVILMDIQMPVIDGLEATRQIRASGRPNAQTIPIIAMTANASEEDEELSMRAGMNKHVVKPIDIQELLKTLQEAMGADR